jgi:hypothetical protein
VITIKGYDIIEKKFDIGVTRADFYKNGTAHVLIHGNGVDSNTKDVPITNVDSEEWIVSKAAVLSQANWQWPWWRRSARRKLAYLRRHGIEDWM